MAQLGKYELVAEIARGGMGIVYLAIAQGPARFSKLLVVKELKPELVDDSNFLEMFLEEARLAARLSHPNIVQTYEIGAEGNRHYIVMDYLEGVTLARVLRLKSERFTLPMQLRVICEVLQGLQYAHTLADFDGTPLGIVHRDATPQNVFVTYDGQMKLVDFGIAKALDSTIETRTGVLKGKPAYMAPEQITGDVDPRADVFAAGVMVWEAIAGHRMWRKKTDVEVLTGILKGELPSLRDAKPDAPPRLLTIVDKALAKDRDQRYPSAAAMQSDLELYLSDTGKLVTTRDVGNLVAELFADERKKMRATIETYIAQLKSGKASSKVPSIRPPSLGHQESPSTPSGKKGVADSSTSEPSLPTGGKTPGATAMPAHSNAPGETPSGGRTKMLAIGGAVALALIGVIAFAATRGSKGGDNATTASRATTEPTNTPVPATSEAPTPAGPGTHRLEVRAVPSTASISVDGAPSANPTIRMCKHGEHLIIHASAPGHVARDREVACERDESLELALVPTAQGAQAQRGAPPPPPPPVRPGAKGAPVAPTPSAAPPPPPPPPATTAATPPAKPNDVNPSGGTRPNRPIDTSSPYGH